MDNWRRTFAIIWSGQLISILSSSIVGYAIIFWLSIETRSAEILAIAAIAAILPQSVLGMFTGVYIDRWNRKLVMIMADSFIALSTLVLVILFFVGKVEPWQIYLLAAARSIGSAFHMPAMQASIPLLAPESELMRIAGINQMIQSVSSIGGPALGALFITLLDMKYVLLFDIVGAVFAVGSLLLVNIPDPVKPKEKKEPHVFMELKEGLAEIYKDRGLTWLFFFGVIAMFFIMPIAVMFPLMTLNHFNGTVMHMSIVEIFWGAGMLAGGAFAGIKKIDFNKALIINYMYLIFGITFFFSGVLPSDGFVWFVVLTAIGGVGTAIYNSAFNSLLQIKINPAMLGRVFSTYMSITMLPSMIGLLGTGFIADRIGLINAFLICGAINFVIGIVSFVIPSIRRTGIVIIKG
jgi:DHA3 family macrolide efflux protein-like MFS transporter